MLKVRMFISFSVKPILIEAYTDYRIESETMGPWWAVRVVLAIKVSRSIPDVLAGVCTQLFLPV